MIYYLEGFYVEEKENVTCSMLLYEASWVLLSRSHPTKCEDRINYHLFDQQKNAFLDFQNFFLIMLFYISYSIYTNYQTAKLHISQ